MSLTTYRRLLGGERRLRLALTAAFLGRLPLGLVTVLLLFAVGTEGRSLGLASLVSAAAVVGMAVGAPVQGRLLDRLPPARVTACCAALQVVALLALAWSLTSAPSWAVVVLSFTQGATVPSLSACVRLVLRRSIGRDDPGPAFSLDAVVMEVIYLTGPAVAAWGTVLIGPELLLTACALLVAAGTAGFLAAARGSWLVPLPPEGDEESGGAAAAGTRLGPVVCFVLAMALVAAPFGMSEVALTRLAAEQGSGLGPVGSTLTLMGLGSVVGGLAYGAVRWRSGPGRRFRLLALGLGLGLTATALTSGFAPAHLLFALAGLCVAPLAGLSFEILDRIGLVGAWMQTQSWGSVANTAGHAGGLALAGALAGSVGASGVFWLTGAAVLLGVLIAGPALAELRRLDRSPAAPDRTPRPVPEPAAPTAQ
ncbi:MFS transporter [Kitasatospora sp. NPDC096147]|uniref:MFS transporter n=1 Tax=Kitasatospora sp. NPDC096147 TaxID=3364093 RepID=UPI003821D646